MASIVLKRGDTLPVLQAQLLDSEGNPVNLTTAEQVRFLMIDRKGNPVVDAPAFIVNAEEGFVQFFWRPEDTSQVGSFNAEFEVTFDDGSILTFPNDRYFTIQIFPDLA